MKKTSIVLQGNAVIKSEGGGCQKSTPFLRQKRKKEREEGFAMKELQKKNKETRKRKLIFSKAVYPYGDCDPREESHCTKKGKNLKIALVGGRNSGRVQMKKHIENK